MDQKTISYKLYVGGKWIEEASSMEVVDKYTGQAFATVPVASRETVAEAVGAAHAAFPGYSRMPAHARAKIIERAVALLEEEKESLADLLCREVGKPWKFSFGEVGRSIDTYRFSAEEAKRIHGETVPLDASAAGEGRIGFYLRRPMGVVAAITPFNFPLNLAAHKLGPALAAGNTVVVKPASVTPLTTIRVAEIFERAGLPPGVLNVVTGPGGTVGNQLVEDPRVSKVSFTGSPPVGEAITRRAGLKKLTMELGSNSGTIVEADADLDDAISRCVVGAFANSGQVCISLQRLFIHKDVAEEFTRRFVEAASKLKVGNPLEKDTDLGPMIGEGEAIRAESWIREAVSQGARLLLGGKREGAVLHPTILTDVRADMKVVCAEVFAPLVALCPYETFDDAVRMVDDSPFGLQAGIFTRDVGKVLKAMDQINVGGIMVNDTSAFRADNMPYGGNKMSGIGREGVRFAIEEMTTIQMVMIKP